MKSWSLMVSLILNSSLYFYHIPIQRRKEPYKRFFKRFQGVLSLRMGTGTCHWTESLFQPLEISDRSPKPQNQEMALTSLGFCNFIFALTGWSFCHFSTFLQIFSILTLCQGLFFVEKSVSDTGHFLNPQQSPLSRSAIKDGGGEKLEN